MKLNIKKVLSLELIGVLGIGLISPIFATVDELQTTEKEETLATDVYFNQVSTFTVTVPKHVTLDNSKTSNYEVTVEGDISSDEEVLVIPEDTFLMKDQSIVNTKNDVEASIEQDKISWIFNEFSTIGNGTITATNLSAGTWKGSFWFNIKLQSNYISVNAKNESGEDIHASATNITGDKKEQLLGSLEETGYIDSADEVDALINVKSDDFDGMAETTFDVSNIAQEGDKVVILHFDETKQQWEYIGTETVDSNGTVTGNFTSYSPVAFVKVTENGSLEKLELEPGLYDANGTLLAIWEETGINDTCSNAASIIKNTYSTSAKLILPKHITTIAEQAFNGCTNLTYIKLNDGLKTINKKAFNGCSGLTTIFIPNTVTTISASEERYSPFYGCSENLKIYCEAESKPSGWSTYWYIYHKDSGGAGGANYYLIMDWGVSRSDYDATTNHDKTITTYTIPTGTTQIPDYAFWNCSNLEEIIIPASVESIGNYAFSGCSKLTKIQLPDNIQIIGNYAFNECKLLSDITWPQKLTSIGNYAFNNCSAITNIILPNSLTSTGTNTFQNCTGLTNIKLSDNLKSINNYTFSGCSNLVEINLPNITTSIGTYAFQNCTKLTNINFGNSLSSIGAYAFTGCTKITSITLPDSMKTIGNYAFNGCKGIKTFRINDGLTTINRNAFNTCSGLTTIFIPNTVTTISASEARYSPFYGCSENLKIYCEAESKPSGWSTYWYAYYKASGGAGGGTYYVKAKWNISRQDYEALININ